MMIRKPAIQKKTVILLLTFFVFCAAEKTAAQNNRSFSDLFPNMDDETRAAVFSEGGRIITQSGGTELRLLSSALAGLNFEADIRGRRPVVLVESLALVPAGSSVSLLDIYNALGNVRDLKGRLYHSHSKNREVPLFESATRVDDPRRRNAIPDPAPALVLPSEDTVYMNLRDNNFGTCFYRSDFSLGGRGVLFNLTNFKTIYYIVVPVIREEKFFARFYIEPLAEGVLIYCAAGADVSDFVAGKVDMPSAIEKRVAVIQGWMAAGLALR
jgi:hypothetical protein